MAGGQPLDERVADQAARWLTLLMSGEATEEDRRNWHDWRRAHPDHDRAWTHIEAVTGRLKAMPPSAGYQVLSPYGRTRSNRRRKSLGLLLWGGAAGVTGLLVTRSRIWQQQFADFRTGTGVQHSLMLEDGSRVLINTRSAITVRFDGQRRLLRLVAGEILITTAAAANGSSDPRPLIVETAEGQVRAIGTRFGVRQDDDRTVVSVQESAVEITPAEVGVMRVLQAGERAAFTRAGVAAPQALTDGDGAWARGQIVAADLPLGEFLADVARYRVGLLRWDPAVADLRVSGVFPLHDTDRILATLPEVLPVHITERTRYWVTISAAR